MDWLRPISRYIVHPLYAWREGRRPYAVLGQLRRSQYFAPDQIQQLQLERVKRIVGYAFEHTAYYRRIMTEYGIRPEMVQSLADLSKFPILTKEDIRANLDAMISDEFTVDHLHYKRTGGSTSVPVKLYVDNAAMEFKDAATMRHNSWAGYYPGDRLAALWGNTDKKLTFKEQLHHALLYRVVTLDTLKMDTPYMLAFVKRVRAFKPTILMGHAHSLYFFACFVAEQGLDNLGFKGIISTAEILYDYERAKIEQVFGPIVFDRYGCEELSVIASECEAHDGLHINAEGLYVEVLEAEADHPGRLIITDLWNRGMPFIRYEIGDMATVKPGVCACGRGLPRLGRVLGRTADVLYTPEGKAISGISILDTFTIHVPGFKQVQVVQDSLDHLTFNVVKDEPRFSNESLRVFGQRVVEFFGPRMQYDINFVAKIAQTERGKYRFSICNIPQVKV